MIIQNIATGVASQTSTNASGLYGVPVATARFQVGA